MRSPRCAQARQPAPEAAQPSSTFPNPLESFTPAPDAAVQGSQGSPTIRRNFATNLLPPIEQLPHTVRQVAHLLGVCSATVYRLTAKGLLAHVRIVNVIRISPNDFARFVAERAR